MTLQFERYHQNPLLYPNPLHRWEAMNVFNCAVTPHNGLYHMHYRAQGVDFVSSDRLRSQHRRHRLEPDGKAGVRAA